MEKSCLKILSSSFETGVYLNFPSHICSPKSGRQFLPHFYISWRKKYQENACDSVHNQRGSGSKSLDSEFQTMGPQRQACCLKSEGEEQAGYPVKIILWVWCQIYYIGVVQSVFPCQTGNDASVHFHKYRNFRWIVKRGYCW